VGCFTHGILRGDGLSVPEVVAVDTVRQFKYETTMLWGDLAIFSSP